MLHKYEAFSLWHSRLIIMIINLNLSLTTVSILKAVTAMNTCPASLSFSKRNCWADEGCSMHSAQWEWLGARDEAAVSLRGTEEGNSYRTELEMHAPSSLGWPVASGNKQVSTWRWMPWGELCDFQLHQLQEPGRVTSFLNL